MEPFISNLLLLARTPACMAGFVTIVTLLINRIFDYLTIKLLIEAGINRVWSVRNRPPFL